MSFNQDNFLGSVAGTSNVNAAIQALDDKVFYKDGSRSMEGPISMDNNLIIGASTVEYKEQAVGTLPATDHISLYGKADKHLYWQADDFVEHKIEAGNLAGPVISTNNALARFDGVTGSLLQNSLVILSDLGDLTGLTGLNLSGASDVDFVTTNAAADAFRVFTSTGGIKLEGESGILFQANSGDIDIQALSDTIDISANIIELNGISISSTDDMTGLNGLDVNGTADIRLISSEGSAQSIFLSAFGGVRIEGGSGVEFRSAGGIRFHPFGTDPGNTTELRLVELLASGTNYTGFKSPDTLAANILYTMPIADGSANQVLSTSGGGAGVLSWVTDAGGNVSNAGGSTDNAIARFDATTGKLIQNSLVTIDNSGDISQDGAIWLHTNGGIGNTFIGLFSATSITTGTINTVLGHSTFDMATEATNCTAIGSNALAQLVTGDNCIGLGISAGYNLTLDDSDDICIGNPGESGDTGVVRIGNSTDHNSTFIAGIVGVTHDNSVMIDHKSVIINSLGQIGTIPSCPSGHLNGLKVTDNSTTTKNVSEGSALSDDETTNLTFSGTKTVNITVSGVGGLDTGSESANTWYYIFIIGDTILVNDTDVLMSTSPTAPTMPAGYDVKRLIGAIRNDDSQDFYDYYTQSTGKDRLYLWRESVSTLQVLSDGTAEAWTDVDVSEFIPPISTQLYMQGTHEGSSDTIPDFVSFRPNGSSLDGVARVYSGKTWGSGIFHIETSATGVIEYQNNGSGDNTDVYAVGFTLSL